jgi:histone-lysine N-methyltransferase SUV39H
VEVNKSEPLLKSRVEREVEKERLFSHLKLSTKLIHENLALVEKFFGQTGYSEAFSVEDAEDHAFMRRAASRKKRRVKRTDIKLEVESLSRSVEGLQLNKQLLHPSLTVREILLSRFDEQGSPPLTFSNNVNDKILHGKFQFLNQYIIGENVRLAPPSTNRGCDCTDCSLGSCICVATSKSYTRRPNGMAVLSSEYIKREIDPTGLHSEITECNELCSCGPDCFNRVVSKGCTVPLEIFLTKKCGYGARSSQNIVEGQFIQAYFGEVITLAELLRREDAENDGDPSYIYSLDWFTEQTNSTMYFVDSKYCGSAMRFVNHSCNPNARCFTVQTHKEDRKVYYLAFFAIRDIPAGTEIRIDYLGGRESNLHQADGEDSDDLVKCHCGEKNCRGTFWIPGTKARRRRRKGQ